MAAAFDTISSLSGWTIETHFVLSDFYSDPARQGTARNDLSSRRRSRVRF